MFMGHDEQEALMAKNAEPTGLDDAIRAQQALVNQLADQHAENLATMQDLGDRLANAHIELNQLYVRKAAQ